MIDRHWLQSVICLAGGELGGKDLDELCQELGVQEEFLPYLLLTAGSFSSWPISQAAFRGAAKSVTRPTQMRGVASGPRLPERQALRQSLAAVLSGSSETFRNRGATPIDIPIKADENIARFRSTARGANAEPQSFILNE